MKNRLVVSRLSTVPHAGAKAPRDVRSLCEQRGYRPINLSPYANQAGLPRVRETIKSATRASGVVPASRRARSVLLQHPLGRLNHSILSRISPSTPTAMLIHDLESLRQPELGRRELDYLSRSDVIIAHNAAMKAHLEAKLPRANVIELGIFDYLLATPTQGKAVESKAAEGDPAQLYLIGSLAPDKAAYVYELPRLPVPIDAYGPGCVRNALPSSVQWRGMIDADSPELPEPGGFGLLWDGDSASSLAGPFGDYLRFSSPHKLSLYIALGLPVIVPKDSAVATMVRTLELGVAVASVAEASEFAATCTPQQWRTYRDHIWQLRKRVVSGSHTLTALQSAEAVL